MSRILAILASASLVAACTGEVAGVTTTVAIENTSTSLAAASTAAVPPTTTASTTTPPSSTTTTSGDPLVPEGSGCTPDSDVLPDGEWYGGVRTFDEQGFSFDLACLYVGEAAEAAAEEDGEESPPPNDYYVRNENDQIRILTVPADTPVTWYTSGDPNDEETGTYARWVEFLATQESYLGIWVTIEAGAVTEIAEWWVP